MEILCTLSLGIFQNNRCTHWKIIDLKNLPILYTHKLYILIPCYTLLILNIQTKSSDNVNRHRLVLLKLREKMGNTNKTLHFSWILVEFHWELDLGICKRKSELKYGNNGLIKCAEHEKHGKGETVERVWIRGTHGLSAEDCENGGPPVQISKLLQEGDFVSTTG